MRVSVVRGIGAFLPGLPVSNHDIAGRLRESNAALETSDAWIRKRTGIRGRHLADLPDGTRLLTSDLAERAARDAITAAGLAPDDVDLLLVATTTPDLTFPATGVIVQQKLGMTRGAALDIQAVCSGFVYALRLADAQIRAGMANTVLVIGAETFSRLLDWGDRSSCVLFGDGAGAILLAGEDCPDDTLPLSRRGLIASDIFSDGRLMECLYVDGGISSTRDVGQLRMNGREVFRNAVACMSSVAQGLARKVGLPSIDTIDWIVPHQANERILDGVARRLEFPAERIIRTVAWHANTAAASVPLALATGHADGRIREGDLCLLLAAGSGFTWGASLLRL